MKLFRLFALVLALGSEVKDALEDRHISPEEAKGIGGKLLALLSELTESFSVEARHSLAAELRSAANDLTSDKL